MLETELLYERDVDSEYRLSKPWLRRTRREGRGPKFLKIGRMIRYRRSDIEEYLAAHTKGPNSSQNKKAADSPSAAKREERNAHAATRR